MNSVCGGKRTFCCTLSPLVACISASLSGSVAAQSACPAGPVALTSGQCQVSGGSIVVATTGRVALDASQTGIIDANDTGISLNAANTTAARARAGGQVRLNGATVRNGAEGNLQQGYVATGMGSRIEVTDGDLAFAALARRDNLHGAVASDLAQITLANTRLALDVSGQSNGTWGLAAETGASITGTGVRVALTSASPTLNATSMRGVLARTGGTVTLTGSEVAIDYALGTLGNGLRADGAGSAIGFSGGSITTGARAIQATGAWASGGGSVQLSGARILANANARTTTITSASLGARVDTGGQLVLDNGSAITTTGRYNYGLYAANAGSLARLSGSTIQVEGEISRGGIWAVSGAQVEVLDGSTIVNRSPLPSATYGIYADNSAGAATPTALRIADSRIASSGNVVGAAIALRFGAQATLDNVVLDTAGSGESVGLWSDASTVIASGLNVHTIGERARGVTVDDSSGSATIDGGTIITRGGTQAHALASRLGGRIDATGLQVETHGPGQSAGASADNSLLSLRDSTVTIHGPNSYGVWAISEPLSSSRGPALITIDGVRVQTLSERGFGAVAQREYQPSPATLQAERLGIDTAGTLAHGLYALSGGVISSANGQVSTRGEAAFGALAYQPDSRITLSATPLSTAGSGAHGALAHSGGTIIGSGSRVVAGGTAAAALLVVGDVDPASGQLSASSASFTDSALTNADGATIGVAGPGSVTLLRSTAQAADAATPHRWLHVGTTADFPLPALARLELPLPISPEPPIPPDDPTIDPPGDPADDPAGDPAAAPAGTAAPRAIDTAPRALPVAAALAPGLADIVLESSTVTGDARTEPGSVSTLTLRESRWNLTGDSNLTHLVNDPSLIDFAAPLAGTYKRLVVQTYTGDGTIALNTFLADDSSPSDLLVIDGGSASGASRLLIKPSGGGGAVTVGNGILVVDAINGGVTTPAAFALAGPVVAGPYEYSLRRSSVDASAPESWFLRSTIECTPSGPSPPCPSPPPPPPPPPPPTPPTPPPPPPPIPPPPTPPPPPPPTPPPTPAYRQEVSLAAALPTMAAYYGRALVDTLHERVGDESLLRARADLAPGGRGVNGAWLRVIGHDGERDGGRRGIYGDRGPSFDYRFDALQIGLDLYRAIDEDRAHRHAGAYLAYGRGEGQVRHQLLDVDFHAGRDEFRARTVGAYWTGFNRKGAYLDAVAQYTWYDLRARSMRLPDTFTDGDGIAVSLETGWPFAPGAGSTADSTTGWRIEPQAQVIWQRVEIDDIVDAAATVRYRSGDSWVGRLGVRVNRLGERDSRRGVRRGSDAWLRVNLWHQFEGAPVTEFSSANGYVPFQAQLDDTWGEVGLGGTWQVSQSGYLFADLDYTWSLDGNQTAWNGKLGMRWHW